MKQLDFGTHLDKPLADVPAGYLAWMISQAWMRHTRWPAVVAAIDELRRRPLEQLHAELATSADIADQLKAKRIERLARKAANRKVLGTQRAARRQAAERAQREAAQARLNALLAEKARRQAQPDDWCDLV